MEIRKLAAVVGLCFAGASAAAQTPPAGLQKGPAPAAPAHVNGPAGQTAAPTGPLANLAPTLIALPFQTLPLLTATTVAQPAPASVNGRTLPNPAAPPATSMPNGQLATGMAPGAPAMAPGAAAPAQPGQAAAGQAQPGGAAAAPEAAAQPGIYIVPNYITPTWLSMPDGDSSVVERMPIITASSPILGSPDTAAPAAPDLSAVAPQFYIDALSSIAPAPLVMEQIAPAPQTLALLQALPSTLPADPAQTYTIPWRILPWPAGGAPAAAAQPTPEPYINNGLLFGGGLGAVGIGNLANLANPRIPNLTTLPNLNPGIPSIPGVPGLPQPPPP